MKINIFGLGYVGNVTALSLVDMGHEVRGIEVVKTKVAALKAGKTPIYEPGLEELLVAANAGKLRGSFYVQSALSPREFGASDGSFICVGTPSLTSGDVDLSQIKATLTTIGRALKNIKRWHDVIIRSTVPPGTVQNELIPILEAQSGKKAGRDFGVGFYPEFLREGTSLADFRNPSLNVLGCLNKETHAFVENAVQVEKKCSQVEILTAEMIKYVNNTFHALKVAFANEVGTLCQGYGVNTQELIGIFLSDKTLNISPYYLRPGFAFGGACLPKEVRATTALFLKKGLKAHLVQSILPSNDEHINRLVTLVQSSGVQKVGFLGVTFKADTDDTRESPLVTTIATLLKMPSYKEKRKITICDRPIVLDKMKKEFGGEVNYAATPARVIAESELLLLGPYRLSDKDWELMKKFKGHIVNLKWFDAPAEVKVLKGYRNFC